MFDYFNLNDVTDYKYMLSAIGKTVNRNGVPIRALITNTELQQNYDDKRISSLEPFKRGDIITYEDKRYMIISEVNENRYNKYKGVMRALTQTVKFNTLDCEIVTVPAYIRTQGMDIKYGNIMATVTGDIYMYMPDNDQAKKLVIGLKFIHDRKVWKVTGNDPFTSPGIRIVSAAKESYNSATDDLDAGITYNPGNSSNGDCRFKITNTKPISVVRGSTVQITTNLNQNPLGVQVKPVYESSDPSIASVSENGFVTGVKEGTATITVYRSANSYFKDTVQVNVTQPASYTMTAQSNKSTVKYNESATITNKVFNNGVEVTNAQVTYKLIYPDGTSVPSYIASLKNTLIRSVDVLNNNSTGSVKDIQLSITLNADPSVFQIVPLSLDFYVQENYTVSIASTHLPANELAFDAEMLLTRTIYKNGVEVSGDTVTWSLVGADKASAVPTTLMTISVDASNQATIHNYNQTGTNATVYVKAVVDGHTDAVAYYSVNAISKVMGKQVSAAKAGRTNTTAFAGFVPKGGADDNITSTGIGQYKAIFTQGEEPVKWTLTDVNGNPTSLAKVFSVNDASYGFNIQGTTTADKPGIVKVTVSLISDPTSKGSFTVYVGG